MQKEFSAVRVFSFDVFDTCISRTYEKPSDLFYHIGLTISPESQTLEKRKVAANNFLISRIDAEKRANRMHGRKRSCNIHEIYSILTLPPQCVRSKFDIMKLELQLEEQCIYAIQSTKKLINELRIKNARIIFISDMYLDKSFIKKLLVKHGLFEEGDGLYVSSENTLTKRSGKLFQHVLSEEKIQPEEMLHHGDDFIADVQNPKRMGIKTKHISESHFYSSKHPVPRESDTLNASRINATLKYLRLTRFYNLPKDNFTTLNTITLLLTEFVLWTFLQAQKKEVRTLYFLAKDNDITYKMAKQLNIYFPSIAVKYLYGSRRAWLAASIHLEDQAWKRLAIPNGKQSSVRDALERINLPHETIKEISQNSGISYDKLNSTTTKLKCSELLDKIFSNGYCITLLNQHIAAERDICLRYFKQEGLLDNSNWAIVDTGWELNCQAALKRIIGIGNIQTNIVGFYFGLSNDHLSTDLAGNAYAFTQIGSIFAKRPVAVEHCFFASTHSSTIGYMDTQNGITPIFAKDYRTEHEVTYSNNLHAFALAFIDQLCKLNISIGYLTSLRKIFTQRASLLLESPKINELNSFRGIKASGDARHTKESLISIFSPLSLNDLLKILFLYLKKRQHEISFVWLEASVADSNTIIRLMFKILFLAKKKHVIDSITDYTNKAK